MDCKNKQWAWSKNGFSPPQPTLVREKALPSCWGNLVKRVICNFLAKLRSKEKVHLLEWFWGSGPESFQFLDWVQIHIQPSLAGILARAAGPWTQMTGNWCRTPRRPWCWGWQRVPCEGRGWSPSLASPRHPTEPALHPQLCKCHVKTLLMLLSSSCDVLLHLCVHPFPLHPRSAEFPYWVCGGSHSACPNCSTLKTTFFFGECKGSFSPFQLLLTCIFLFIPQHHMFWHHIERAALPWKNI